MATGLYGGPCISRHRATVYDRGGRVVVTTLIDIAKVTWGRVMDNISAAEVVIAGRACNAQIADLRKIEARRHELVIYRGSERVWEGPIVRTVSTGQSFTISATDVLTYLQFTSLSKDWPAPPIGPTLMVDRIAQIIEYELTTDYTMMTNDGPVTVKRWENIDPPANILPFLDIGPGTTKTTSDTSAFQKTVGSHMHDLGQSIGVNYTTVGRKIVVWDGELSSTRTMTEKDFNGDLQVIKDGSSMHIISHASSQQQEQNAPSLVGHAANDQSYYGPWEAIATVEDTGGGVSTADSSSGTHAVTTTSRPPAVAHFGGGDSTTYSNANASTGTINKPVNTQVGDLLVGIFYNQFTGGAIASGLPGWTQAINNGVRAGGVYYLPIPDAATLAGLPSSWTPVYGSGQGGRLAFDIFRVTGADLAASGGPIDVVSSAYPAQAAGNVTIPSITTTQDNDLLLAYTYWNASAATTSVVTPDAALTEGEQVSSPTTGNTSGIDISTKALGTAGATGSFVQTVSPAASSNSGVLLAIKSLQVTTTTYVSDSGSSGADYASKVSALNSQARRDLYGLYPLPVQLTTPNGSSFVLNETLGINDLVAGTNVPVRATHNITPVFQLQRLASLQVVEDASNEVITGSLTAIGEVTT